MGWIGSLFKSGDSSDKKTARARVPSQPKGTAGLKQYGGIIDEEWHRNLSGTKGIKVYREMYDNDPTVNSVIGLIKALVKNVEFTVEPSDPKSRSACDQADFVEECIDDMSHTWSSFITEVFSLLVFGWSYFEKCYKYRGGDTNNPLTRSKYNDGKIGWRKIEIRSQDSLEKWEFDEDGSLRGMHQQPEAGPKAFIPIEDAILFRFDGTKGNPEGRSALRGAYTAWYKKKQHEIFESIRAERDASGLPHVTLPPHLLDEDNDQYDAELIASYEKMGSSVRLDERGCIITAAPEIDGQKTGFDFELLQSTGAPAVNANEVILRYRAEIAISIFYAGFLFLGHESHGSFALSSNKTDIFATALGSLLDDVCETFTRYAIYPLMRINGVPDRDWPYLSHGDIESPDLQQVGDFINKLAAPGFITPDEKIENRLRELIHMPEHTPDKISQDGQQDPERGKDIEALSAKLDKLEQMLLQMSDKKPEPANVMSSEDNSAVGKAQLTRAFINDLPDSAFLYVEPGGRKDDEGKTVPRSLRHFPVRDKNGDLDLPHLRNAIARIPQAKIPGLTAADLREIQDKARELFWDNFETILGQ